MATFYNRATLSYNGGVVNSNTTSGELLAPLSVTKTAIVDEYSDQSEISYAVNILNAGTVAVNGLTVLDDLGAYEYNTTTYIPLDYIDGSVKYFVNGILQPTPAVTTVNGLQILAIDVPADGVATLLYTTRVNSFAPLDVGSSIENNVTLTGDCAEGITDSQVITAEEGIDLDITKSLAPTTVTCAGNLSYTIEIFNNGNRATLATDNVVVTDVFNPPIQNITVTYNGTPWTQPDDYSYDPVTGVFTSVIGAITVPPATYARDPESGEWVTTQGSVSLVISGNL